MINLCIIHYNTPYLTEHLVCSINKFVGKNCKIYIFDNSDKNPFTYRQDNIVYIDNTKGQIINFDEWLKKYPNRNQSHGKINNFGSAKHCYSVEKCFDLINDNFILLDSDILLKRNIENLIDEKSIFCAEVVTKPLSTIKRVVPFICYINVKFCKEHGIHYFNDNYMHGLRNTKINKNADFYDTGAGFYEMSKKFSYTEIKCDNYIVHFKGGSWKDEHKKSYGCHISETDWIKNNKKYWKMTGENKKVVYTCISGTYDTLKDPSFVNEDYDYICFTDQNFKSNIWEIRPIPEDLNNLSQVKKQRNIKLLPHKYLTEYDFSVWIDGNVDIKDDINKYFKVNGKIEDGPIIVGKHPSRNCIYDEAKAVLALNKDKKENVDKQILKYKNEKFPAKYGLPQTCIMARYHNNKECIELMEIWWEELKNGSHRDQLSFSYACWKYKECKVHYVDKSIFDCAWFKWCAGHCKKPVNIVKSQAKQTVVKPNVSKLTPFERKQTKVKNIRKITFNRPI